MVEIRTAGNSCARCGKWPRGIVDDERWVLEHLGEYTIEGVWDTPRQVLLYKPCATFYNALSGIRVRRECKHGN